jgi:hypothetical protein
MINAGGHDGASDHDPGSLPGDYRPPWRSKRSTPSRLSRVETRWMASFITRVLVVLVIDPPVLGAILATVIRSELIAGR